MNISIIGTGYVGLVTAACFAEFGNNVCCVDNNPEVIANLKDGKIHIYEPGLEPMVQRGIESERLQFTMDMDEGVRDSLFIFNCVGTPSNHDGSCDLSYVRAAAEQIGKVISDYKIIINKSTVPVGTAEMVESIIREELTRRKINIEFDVVSNPEFLKEGSAIGDFLKPDRIIVGTDNVRTARLLEHLYSPFARQREKLIVMDVRSAEMTKYAANSMLATKISFINEMANICERVGADIEKVRLGIGSDKRIGYHFIYPGVGYGGSCFPKDVKALADTARKNGYTPSVLEAVDQVNSRQKTVLVEKLKNYFAQKDGIGNKSLALWGLAFKNKTDDIREAASIEIIEALTSEGMRIRAFDPAAGANAARKFNGNALFKVCNDEYECLQGADALMVVTDWDQFKNPDFKKIKSMLKNAVIFDGRNLYDPVFLKDLEIDYYCIGRMAGALCVKSEKCD
jgi:UDPglucose 6-dehydrogenase